MSYWRSEAKCKPGVGAGYRRLALGQRELLSEELLSLRPRSTLFQNILTLIEASPLILDMVSLALRYHLHFTRLFGLPGGPTRELCCESAQSHTLLGTEGVPLEQETLTFLLTHPTATTEQKHHM